MSRTGARQPEGRGQRAGRIPPRRVAALRRRLLAWYRECARDLPWRRTRDPYRIWVSEVMLQQTRAATVVPYYESFLRRYPDVRTLAAADPDEVLAGWSGLGYYTRARNLHRAAGLVVREHGGRFPRDPDAVRALPGVGPSTAGAILSVAFGVPRPAVDGNVVRVLSRLEAPSGAGDRAAVIAAVQEAARRLVPEEDPGAWNQSLMELGARICLPRMPRCGACPVRRLCRALRQGRIGELPPRARSRPPVDLRLAVALVTRRGRLLLIRRPEGALLGGLWELPAVRVDGKGTAVDALRDCLQEHCGIDEPVGPEVGRFTHAVTHHRIDARVHRIELAAAPPRKPRAPGRWVRPAQVETLASSSMLRKALAAAGLETPTSTSTSGRRR